MYVCLNNKYIIMRGAKRVCSFDFHNFDCSLAPHAPISCVIVLHWHAYQQLWAALSDKRLDLPTDVHI